MNAKTPNLNLNLPAFNLEPWHDLVNDNFRSLDATIRSIFGLTNLLGEYQNSTAVTIGQRYFDVTTGFYYEALSNFVTEPLPTTFAEERAAYPNRWAVLDAAQAFEALKEFQTWYLGVFPVAPVVDNQGNPLRTGAMYGDTSLNELFIYDVLGSGWVSFASGTVAVDRVFPTRASAMAATIDPGTSLIQVLHSGVLLSYERDAATAYPALVTQGADKWVPADGQVSPLHWGAIGNGFANDQPAVQSMVNYMSNDIVDKPVAFERPMFVVSGYSKQYAVAAPIIIGNVGAGVGMLYHVAFNELRLKAIAGDWSGTIAPGIDKQVIVAAYRDGTPYNDQGKGIFGLSLTKVFIDCGYVTGGMYFENTNSTGIFNCRIARMGKNRRGYYTGQSRTSNTAEPHPTNVLIGNGFMYIDGLKIAGLEEELDPNFPPGEDQITMNTTAFLHRTNDAIIRGVNLSRCTHAGAIEDCGAVQMSDFHPWCRQFYLKNTRNIRISEGYFDYTALFVYSNAMRDLSLDNCMWPLGSELTPTRDLHLVATEANETGKNLTLTNCHFSGENDDLTIHLEEEGAGSWADILDRTYEMHAVTFGSYLSAPGYTQRISNRLLVSKGGIVQIKRVDDPTKGVMSLGSNYVYLGIDRTAPGLSELGFFSTDGVAKTGEIAQFASGLMSITTSVANQGVQIGNSVSGNAIEVDENGRIINVTDPAAAKDVVNKQYLEANSFVVVSEVVYPAQNNAYEKEPVTVTKYSDGRMKMSTNITLVRDPSGDALFGQFTFPEPFAPGVGTPVVDFAVIGRPASMNARDFSAPYAEDPFANSMSIWMSRIRGSISSGQEGLVRVNVWGHHP